VPQAPDQPQPGRAPQPGPRSCRKRRDGRKMVWLKGMAEAQEATDSQNRYN
jgi:hypothetical protein